MAIFSWLRITRTGIVFIAGIIILVALVLGAIWLVRERGEQARRQEAVKIAEANLEEQSTTTEKTEPKTTTETTTTPASTDTETESETHTAATGSENSKALPETGPEIGHVFVLGFLTLAISYYITSRRAATRL